MPYDIEWAKSNSHGKYVEALVKDAPGLKSIPVRTKIHVPSESIASCTLPSTWQRKNHAQPRRQENSFCIMERDGKLPKDPHVKDVHKTHTLPHTEGMDRDINIIPVDRSLEQRQITFDMKDDLNKRRKGLGLSARGRMARIEEYTLSLEWYNLCRFCYQPINTRRHKINPYMKTRVARKNPLNKSYMRFQPLTKQTYSKARFGDKTLGFGKTVQLDTVVEIATVPAHWEVKMLVDGVLVPFNTIAYLREKSILKAVFVEAEISKRDKCGCFGREERDRERKDRQERESGSLR